MFNKSRDLKRNKNFQLRHPKEHNFSSSFFTKFFHRYAHDLVIKALIVMHNYADVFDWKIFS